MFAAFCTSAEINAQFTKTCLTRKHIVDFFLMLSLQIKVYFVLPGKICFRDLRKISAVVQKVLNMEVVQFLLLNKIAFYNNLNFLLQPVGLTQIQVFT
jgi:hypothetical protein